MTSSTICTPTSVAEDASFTSNFSLVWTLVGGLFTLFSFFLTAYLAFVRRDPVVKRLDSVLNVLRGIQADSSHLREAQRDVALLRMALTAQGQSFAETMRTLQQLTTDFEALADEVRETREVVTGLMTDDQEPARPVLLEILAELRASRGVPQVQSWLMPFSFQVQLNAQTIVLARERAQANSNPFPDLD